MIPVLYGATETSFTSLGIGALNDSISCIVTENRNGSYELELKYPQTGPLFSEILISRIIKAVPAYAKNPEPFRIYKISKPIKGIITVNAEHISYQLSYIPVTAFSATTVAGALQGLKSHSAEDNPFTFATDKNTTAKFTVTKPASIRSLLGGTAGSILDVYGGEYEFNGYTVRLHNNRGQNRGVTLRYGKNITDLKQEESIASTITGVCPYWQSTEDETKIVTLPEHCVYSDKASNFPYKRTIVKDFSDAFEEEPTVEQLRAKANSYISKSGIGIPAVSLDVKFVVLQQMEEYKEYAFMEAVNLCDTVNVEFESLNISATAKVVTTKWNVLADMYDSVTLGSAKAKLDNTLSELADATQEVADDVDKNIKDVKKIVEIDMEKEIAYATKQITGANGGYVVINQDSDGHPTEILIMDTPNKSTAVNVWRFNSGGLGHSHSGYDGPFDDIALTQDGHVVADRIASNYIAGITIEGSTIRGNEIEGGSVKGAEVEFEEGTVGGWVLQKNEMYINSSKPQSDGKYLRAYLSRPGFQNWTFAITKVSDPESTTPGSLNDTLFQVDGNGNVHCYNHTIQADPVVSLNATLGTMGSKNGISTAGKVTEKLKNESGSTSTCTCVGAVGDQEMMLHYSGGAIQVIVNGSQVGTISIN